MGAYQSDRGWSDQFIPLIKDIVGPHLLCAAPMELDVKQATDLIVFRARDMRIAARIRRPGFMTRYGDEFTIRSARDSGTKTELEKIREGWGDWFFYGHALPSGSIGLWYLIDLQSLRYFLRNPPPLLISSRKSNRDGTYFQAFNVFSFPEKPRLIISTSLELPPLRLHRQLDNTIHEARIA